MEIDLNRLSAVETPVRGVLRLSDLPDGSLAADGIRFPEPFRFEGAARRSHGHAVVTGHVTGVLELECGRCLTRTGQQVDLVFEARYAAADAAPHQPAAAPAPVHGKWDDDDDGGIELRPEDLDVSFLPQGTTTLQVEEVVREQILLEVPIRPLCRPDCKGLCSHCGADLNDGACGCPRDEGGDLRMAALAEVKKRLEGGSGRGQKN